MPRPRSIILFACLCAAGARAGEIVVFDARKAQFADTLTLTCLQGVVNRDAPRLYLVFRSADLQWPGFYAKAFALKLARLEGRDALLRRFRSRLKGYVVWDPAALDTANLATTLAGIEDALVVAPDGDAEAKKLGLKRLHDLRGQFGGKTKADVYAWARKNLWPRCSHDLVGSLPLTARAPVEIDASRFLADSGDLYVRIEDAVTADGGGARLYELRLAWGEGRRIAFRAGSSGEKPYLLDPGRSWVDRQGGRAADRGQACLYRFRLPKGARARLTLDIYGQYLVRAAGRPGGPYEAVARSRRMSRRPSHEIRDLLVARRALVFDLEAGPDKPREASLRSQFLAAGKARVLSGGPPNLSFHRHMAAALLVGVQNVQGAVPHATYAAVDLSHGTGAAIADPDATCLRVQVGRPGKDDPRKHLVYGPYVSVPPGRYAVAWRLKAVGKLADKPLATIDLYDVRDKGRFYARRALKGTDFAAGRYQWFVLTAEVKKQATLEYRVQWHGGAELRVGRIVVWSL